MWNVLVELQSRYNQDMWREIDWDNVVDWVNYQTQQIGDLDIEHLTWIDSVLQDSEVDASWFVYDYLAVEITEFLPSNSYNTRAIGAIVGVPTAVITLINATLGTVKAIVATIGAVLQWIAILSIVAALAVLTMSLIMYWSSFKAHFDNIVSQFVSVAGGAVADAIKINFGRYSKDKEARTIKRRYFDRIYPGYNEYKCKVTITNKIDPFVRVQRKDTILDNNGEIVGVLKYHEDL
jgi:hypothetical protein